MNLFSWIGRAKQRGHSIRAGAGDPFREYRRTHFLPSTFQYGMCCFLDRISEMEGKGVAQKAYQEIRAVPDAYTFNTSGTRCDIPEIPILFSVTDLHAGLTALEKAIADMGLKPIAYGLTPERAVGAIGNHPLRFCIVVDSDAGCNHAVLGYKTTEDGRVVIDHDGRAVFPSELVNPSIGKVAMFVISRKNESFRVSEPILEELTPAESKDIGPFFVGDFDDRSREVLTKFMKVDGVLGGGIDESKENRPYVITLQKGKDSRRSRETIIKIAKEYRINLILRVVDYELCIKGSDSAEVERHEYKYGMVSTSGK